MTSKVDAPSLIEIIEPKHPNTPRIYVYASSRAGHGPYRVIAFRGRYDCPCSGAAGAAKAARAGRITKSGGECRHKRDAREREEARNQAATAEVAEGEPMTTNDAPGREVATVQPGATALARGDGRHEAPLAHYMPSVGDLLPSPAQFDMMMRIASTVTAAGTGANSMVPDNIKTPEAALAVMLAGHELGFPPFAALRQVFLVNGKTELMTEGKLALMRQRDPSLRIEWHRGARRGLLEDGMRGAEATLWRNGEPMCRIRYDEVDKARAHQGQKRAGPRKWIPVYEADGRTQKKHPAGHAKAGEGMVRMNPEFNENAPGAYEDDPESPWSKFEPDMYDWAVTKRLERYGASDLVNLAPLQVVEAMPGAWTVEEDREIPEAPRTPLSRAIIAGEIEPARVVAESSIPEPENDDPDEPPPADDDSVQTPGDDDDEEPAPTGAGGALDPDDLPLAEVRDVAPVPTAEELEEITNAARQKLFDEAIRIKNAGTLPANEYGALIRSLGTKYQPEAGGKLSTETLTLEQAREALAELLAGAGEEPPPEATS